MSGYRDIYKEVVSINGTTIICDMLCILDEGTVWGLTDYCNMTWFFSPYWVNGHERGIISR